MCLSIPARIVSIDGSMAEVSAGGAIFKAGLHMIEDAKVETISFCMPDLQFRR